MKLIKMLFCMAFMASMFVTDTQAVSPAGGKIGQTGLAVATDMDTHTIVIDNAKHNLKGFRWSTAIIIILLLGYVLFAYVWFKTNSKSKQLLALGKSIVSYSGDLVAALKDGKLSDDEKNVLQTDYETVVAKWKTFLKFNFNASTE